MRLRKTAQQLARQIHWERPTVRAIHTVKHGASWAVEFTDEQGNDQQFYSPAEWARTKQPEEVTR